MSASAPIMIPRQLVVLSGKGGTGKTSVVAALAALAPDKVLADCDVDAANLHLVLDPKPVYREAFFAGRTAAILANRCSACGECADHCRFHAISLGMVNSDRSTYTVDRMSCEGCGMCAQVCTCSAVEMLTPERGEWFISDTRHGPLIHARLGVGGENSGKLVTLVKNQAWTLAEQTGTALILVDGPPGISCPTIASVTGADLVLLVAEPSVSGVHDLERAVRLVRSFAVPMAVCVNKADLNPEIAQSIGALCATRGLPLVGQLAYDNAVVRAQLEGRSIVEYAESQVARQVRDMWAVLDEMLNTTEV
jgi:MinD superfamily P-loop ATPase